LQGSSALRIDPLSCPWLASLSGTVSGVGHPVNQTTRPSRPFSGTVPTELPSFQSRVVQVGHPVQSLSQVRSADPRSAEIRRPAGVTRSFQISLYKVEPDKAIRPCNLLTHDD
jgi:hypothetical protein